MNKQIVLDNVTKIFKQNKENELFSVNDISLQIESGEFIAIVGKSGSGKTTLLKIIGGLLDISVGKLLFNNQLIKKNTKKLMLKHTGFILQDFALLENETVYYNASIPLWLDKNIPIKKIKNKTREILKTLGILEFEKKLVNKLSGGQKQRVAIARTLVKDCEIILADEPTGSLDEKNSQMIIDILKAVNQQGKTVIIVTHDNTIANQCNRIIELVDGKIVRDNKRG